MGDTRGPVTDVVIDPEYLDVSVPPKASFTHPTVPGHTTLAYVIGGEGVFCGKGDAFSYDAVGVNYFDFAKDRLIGDRTLIVYGNGDAVRVSAGDEGVRFLFISGRPIRKSVAWHGPIVMNTREELRRAFEDLDNGTFLRYEEDRAPPGPLQSGSVLRVQVVDVADVYRKQRGRLGARDPAADQRDRNDEHRGPQHDEKVDQM